MGPGGRRATCPAATAAAGARRGGRVVPRRGSRGALRLRQRHGRAHRHLRCLAARRPPLPAGAPRIREEEEEEKEKGGRDARSTLLLLCCCCFC